MPPCVALLRAVNLGPHNKVAMTDLQTVCAKAGLTSPRTLLQTGNVVFDSNASPAEIEALIEGALAKRLQLKTTVMVRSRTALDTVIRNNPFPAEASDDPSHLVVVFLKSAVTNAVAAEVQARAPGREAVRSNGAHLYIYYPDGIGTSRLTGASIDRVTGTPGTGRNWNTVLKLRDLASAS